MGGQACVFYGAAELSRACDIVIDGLFSFTQTTPDQKNLPGPVVPKTGVHFSFQAFVETRKQDLPQILSLPSRVSTLFTGDDTITLRPPLRSLGIAQGGQKRRKIRRLQLLKRAVRTKLTIDGPSLIRLK